MTSAVVTVLSPVIEPLDLGFFRSGLLAAVLVMLAGAAVGFGVVQSRQAYFGQGVGQSMVAGVAVGALYGIAATPAAFVGALLAALLIRGLARRDDTPSDTAIALVATTALSVGVAVISANRERSVNVSNVLFGNVLGITAAELLLLTVVAAFAWGHTLLRGRKVALTLLAPGVATAHGIDTRRIELERTLLLTAVTASAVQVVGVTLVVAALVFPAATAGTLARRLGSIHIIAAGAAATTGILGMYLSYWADIASGPALVMIAAAVHTGALLMRR